MLRGQVNVFESWQTEGTEIKLIPQLTQFSVNTSEDYLLIISELNAVFHCKLFFLSSLFIPSFNLQSLVIVAPSVHN